ncbi:MAG: DUF3150 domain-containing protein [Verrucomicrobiales bacterium]
MSLGHKRLLPKDALQELSLVEGRTHAFVKGNTFPFLNALGHFLPKGRLEEVTLRPNQLEHEFWQAKQNFLQKYSTLRTNASREWRQQAEKLVDDPARLVAAIEAAFPLSREMDRYFSFDVQMFQITLPERLQFDLVTYAEHQEVITARQMAAQQAAEKIRRDTESFVADCLAALREQTASARKCSA